MNYNKKKFRTPRTFPEWGDIETFVSFHKGWGQGQGSGNGSHIEKGIGFAGGVDHPKGPFTGSTDQYWFKAVTYGQIGNNSASYCDRSGKGATYQFCRPLLGKYALYEPRLIDNYVTVITCAHGDFAEGYIMRIDLSLIPVYIAKGHGQFAHGRTLREAYSDLQRKIEGVLSDVERIEKFITVFPEYDKPYSNQQLFDWHGILTESCFQGRVLFAEEYNIDLKGEMTIRQFINLTKDAFGGQVILKLKKEYEKEEN